MKRVILTALLPAITLISGCATLTTGTDNSVTIDTVPPGASCELRQGADRVYFVNPTPGTIEIEKSKKDVGVVCQKEGYLPEAGVLTSELQSMSFGNVLFGGVIGVAVDASSGALNDYPPMMRLIMTPDTFPDQESYEAYFTKRRGEIDAAHEAALTGAEAYCKSDEDQCEERKKAADEAYETALTELAAKRQAAKIEAETKEQS